MQLPAYYEYCNKVKTVAGHDALDKIPELLAELNAQKPLIITDKGVAGAGLIDIVKSAIGDQVQIGAICDDVPPDSDLKVVNQLAEVYNEKGCDSIIAVGGGSVLDTAKGVNIVVSEKSDDLMKFAGAGALKRPLNPLLAVPTTSGTGSEVTLVAVIADHEKDLKMLFTSYFLLPDAAILDSRMTLTLPPFLTSPTGMDALCHAVEAYTCLGKNPMSDNMALSAIKLINDNLLNVVKNPGDKEGRLALAIASNQAGTAFSNSMVGMVHSIGHSVGAVCHIPHGTCMAILLPYALEVNYHKIREQLAELAVPFLGTQFYQTQNDPEIKARKVIARIRELNDQLKEATDGRHVTRFADFKNRDGSPAMTPDHFDKIARTTLGDGSITYNPEELSKEEILEVLNAAYEGRPMEKGIFRKNHQR